MVGVAKRPSKMAKSPGPIAAHEGEGLELFTGSQWRQLERHLGLTARQAEIAPLVCKGLRNKEIGQRLGISPHTVRMHLSSLFKRLGVRDRVGLVVRLVLAARHP
jgi:DNA-binding CsgD family transcriptional regulator